MKTGIIVLGMHRSGTSMIAKMIHKWGAYAGPESDLMRADEWNASGYWEYLPLVDFNDQLLASIKSIWFVPPIHDDELQKKAEQPENREKALELIASMEHEQEHWFWKDPRLAILLPFWKKIWNKVIYVICLRHPLEIANSLKKRNRFPVTASLLLWQIYMLSILKYTEDSECKIFVDYNAIVQEPVKQCELLCHFFEQQPGCTQSPGQKVNAMLEAIDSHLRHHTSSSTFTNFKFATRDQIELQHFLRQKTKNPHEKCDFTRFPIYPGWREYLLTLADLVRMRIKLNRHIRGENQTSAK